MMHSLLFIHVMLYYYFKPYSFLLCLHILHKCVITYVYVTIPVGDGISIPCSYTSHVVPISAPKLHADLASTDAKLKVCMYIS